MPLAIEGRGGTRPLPAPGAGAPVFPPGGSAARWKPPAPAPAAPGRGGRPPAWAIGVEIVLACALAVVGGWAAVTLATRAAATVPLVSTRLVAVAVLTPLLSLPMLSSVPPDRAPAHTSSMASTLVALALLNLCCLVPLLTIVWHVNSGLS